MLYSCTGIKKLYTCPNNEEQADIGLIHDAAIAWEDERICFVGKESDLPSQYLKAKNFAAEGKIALPGLVDCHTHLAFGGWRAEEFAMRQKGTSYLEIAAAGGGIQSTVEATRKASFDELYEKAKSFLNKILEMGVTCIECKSGYGLNLESERKQLAVYKKLAKESPLTIVPTFLGAHIVPKEYKEDREAYIQILIKEMLPSIRKDNLAEFFDIFVEKSAFSYEEAQRVLKAAKNLGFAIKLHVDQLSDSNGGALALEFSATSADHLEFSSKKSIHAFKEAGSVAVSLPLATAVLGMRPLCAREFIQAKVPLAVATDFNPGSAPTYDIHLAMWLACVLQKMTPDEALKGATIYAAKASGKEKEHGSIEVGKFANFFLLDSSSWTEHLYHYLSRKVEVFCKGKPLFATLSPKKEEE